MTSTQRETEKGNASIAAFMKAVPIWDKMQPDGNSKTEVGYPEPCPDGQRLWAIADLKYHSDWNWLMPVVEKIENISYNGFDIVVSISKSGAYIGINPTDWTGRKYEGKLEIADTLNCNYFNDFDGADKVSKIEAVWRAVINFILWYNLNTPQQ